MIKMDKNKQEDKEKQILELKAKLFDIDNHMKMLQNEYHKVGMELQSIIQEEKKNDTNNT